MKKTRFLILVLLLLLISMLGATSALGKTLATPHIHDNTLTNDSPYGATMDPGYNFTNAAVADWQNLGMRWVRKQFNWYAIETSPGVYDFSQVDAMVAKANAAGILVDFPIQNPPAWHEDPQHCNLPIAADEAAFARVLVNRYGSQIAAYEVGNEEWSYAGKCQNDAQLYIPTLKQTYTAIKALNPNVLVGMYGYTNYGQGGISYIHQFFVGTPLDPGLFADSTNPGKYMDYINFHYYIGGDPDGNKLPFDDVVNEIHNDAALYGHASKPIWATEYGWALSQNLTQAKQSQYLQEIYDNSRTGGLVTHAFFYTIDESNDGFSITQNGAPTLAYDMVKSYIARYPQW